MLFYFLHFEGGVIGGAIVFLTKSFPLHDTILDGSDFPPLTLFLIIVDPTGAEQCTIHEILIQGVGTWYPFASTVLHIIDEVSIILVLPTIFSARLSAGFTGLSS